MAVVDWGIDLNANCKKNQRHVQENKDKSTAEMVNAMEQRDSMSGKSGDFLNEGKLTVDLSSNIIPINILNRPRPIHVYRYNEFWRSGRLSWNWVRDSKGIVVTFYSYFLGSSWSFFHISYYIWSYFSQGTNKKWRIIT